MSPSCVICIQQLYYHPSLVLIQHQVIITLFFRMRHPNYRALRRNANIFGNSTYRKCTNETPLWSQVEPKWFGRTLGSTWELFKYQNHSRKVLKSKISEVPWKEIIGGRGRECDLGIGLTNEMQNSYLNFNFRKQ